MADEYRLRLKWWLTWQRFGFRVWKLPARMQRILIEDVETAIENRLAVLECVNAKC